MLFLKKIHWALLEVTFSIKTIHYVDFYKIDEKWQLLFSDLKYDLTMVIVYFFRFSKSWQSTEKNGFVVTLKKNSSF